MPPAAKRLSPAAGAGALASPAAPSAGQQSGGGSGKFRHVPFRTVEAGRVGAPTPHRHPSSAEAQRDRGPLHSPNSLCGVRASSSVGLPRSLSQAHVQPTPRAPRLCRHLGLLTSPSPMGSGGAEVQRKPGPAWGLVTRVDGSKSQSFCGVRAGPWCPLSRTRARVQGRWQTVLELGICPPPRPLTAHTGHLGACGHLAVAGDQRFAWLTRLCVKRDCFSKCIHVFRLAFAWGKCFRRF